MPNRTNQPNRREFFRLLALGVAGTVASAELDIDRLLWVPGRKTIFLPTTSEVSLYGIPYHQTDALTGNWLGISRLHIIMPELKALIKSINDIKLKE